MENMNKIIHIGTGPQGHIFCKIEFKDGRLSITGVEGPTRDGNARGGCGQIDSTIHEYLNANTIQLAVCWNAALLRHFLDIWDQWHLNDMRAGCAHQRAEFDTNKMLPLTEYTWSQQYHDARRKATDGTLTDQEYSDYQAVVRRVMAATIGMNAPKYETGEIAALLKEGWITAGKTETKPAGHVTASEHPEGLLSRVCETCGYKYGSAWLKEEVPERVINFLKALPDTDMTPAWV